MSTRRLLLALLCLLAVAVPLRFVGLGWLLPCFVEPDAHIAVQVQLLEAGDPEPSRRIDYGKYPHLVAWTTMALTPRPDPGELAPDAAIELHLAAASEPFRRVRVAVAFLSLLALPATWLLARLWWSRGVALTAVWWMATSLLAVHFAAQGRPHGAAVGFFPLAVAASVALLRRGSLSAYATAALACALCFGSLQSGIAVYASLALAHLLAGPARSARHARLLLPALAFAAALFALYPFWFTGRGADGGRVQLEGTQIDQAGHLIMLHAFNGRGVPVLARALASWEPVLCLGLLVGGGIWLADRWRRRPGVIPRRELGVVLAFVLPYAVVIGLYQRSYERFLLPLLPFLCVFCAWALARVLCAAEGSRIARPLALAGALLALGLPPAVGLQLVRARSAPDTFHQAADCLRANLDPAQERLALSFPLILPLWSTPEAISSLPMPRQRNRGMAWIHHQQDHPADARSEPAWDLRWMPMNRPGLRQLLMQFPRTFVRSLDAEWALIEVFEPGRVDPSMSTLRIALEGNADLRVRFGPDPDPFSSPIPLTYQDETGGSLPWMAARLLRARRTGPVLELYRLPPKPIREG
jgi:hypothetical protein